VGLIFTLVGFGFKIALVPFQFWAPDVYEGAPTPITAFLSVVSKAAGLAVIVRFLAVVGLPAGGAWSAYWILAVLTVLSMFYGNLVAIPQRNIKRMLAYSSIAQVGYMMIGVLSAMHTFAGSSGAYSRGPSAALWADIAGAGSAIPWDMQGVLIYILAYLFMNLGAFAVVVAVGKRLGSDRIESYAGLMKRSPFFASALTVFLVSLAGIPPTAGFLGKFLIFGGAIRTGLAGHPELVALAVLGIANSVISAYYYLNVVRLMFFLPGESEQEVRAGYAVNAVVAVLLFLTLAMVVFARPVSNVTADAVYSVFTGPVR
jgi:NADH-quinone oxidoreductase subunit N